MAQGALSAQVLYLPTCRRIEQDLQSIFPGTEIETEIKKVRDRVARRGTSTYTELVAIGMEGIERTIGLADLPQPQRPILAGGSLKGAFASNPQRRWLDFLTFETILLPNRRTYAGSSGSASLGQRGSQLSAVLLLLEVPCCTSTPVTPGS